MRFCVVLGRVGRRDEPRGPKRKKEKPREVKILWNSSAEPGPKPHKRALARPAPPNCCARPRATARGGGPSRCAFAGIVR